MITLLILTIIRLCSRRRNNRLPDATTEPIS